MNQAPIEFMETEDSYLIYARNKVPIEFLGTEDNYLKISYEQSIY